MFFFVCLFFCWILRRCFEEEEEDIQAERTACTQRPSGQEINQERGLGQPEQASHVMVRSEVSPVVRGEPWKGFDAATTYSDLCFMDKDWSSEENEQLEGKRLGEGERWQGVLIAQTAEAEGFFQ